MGRLATTHLSSSPSVSSSVSSSTSSSSTQSSTFSYCSPSIIFFRGLFVCRLLNETSGSLLDDLQLVNTLQTSKVTSTEVSEQLETSEQTEIMIDTAREVGHSHTLFLSTVAFQAGGAQSTKTPASQSLGQQEATKAACTKHEMEP